MPQIACKISIFVSFTDGKFLIIRLSDAFISFHTVMTIMLSNHVPKLFPKKFATLEHNVDSTKAQIIKLVMLMMMMIKLKINYAKLLSQ